MTENHSACLVLGNHRNGMITWALFSRIGIQSRISMQKMFDIIIQLDRLLFHHIGRQRHIIKILHTRIDETIIILVLDCYGFFWVYVI